MKVEMTKAGPVDGVPHVAGDVVDVDGVTASRMMRRGFARAPSGELFGTETGEDQKGGKKTAEPGPTKTAETGPKQTRGADDTTSGENEPDPDVSKTDADKPSGKK